MPLTLTKEQIVQKLYIAYFNRPADAAGAAAWLAALNNGATEAQIAEGFATSPEFIATYGNQSSINYISALYNNMFGHKPDTEGLIFWSTMLDSGKINRAQLPVTMLNNLGATDTAVVLNKLQVALSFTSLLTNSANSAQAITAYQPTNTQVIETVRGYLSAVNDDRSSLDLAVAKLREFVSGLGDNLTLSTQNLVEITSATADTRTGSGISGGKMTGAGNDWIRIKNLSILDAEIHGNAGNDTLELIGNSSIVNANLSGIENLVLTRATDEDNYYSTYSFMSVEQYNSFTGTITAPGVNDYISFLQNSGTYGKVTSVSFTARSGIERYNCNAKLDYKITGSDSGNTFSFVNELNSRDIIKGGSSLNDVVNINVDNSAVDDLDNITGVETIRIYIFGENSKINYRPGGAFSADTTEVRFIASVFGKNQTLDLNLSNITNRGLYVDLYPGEKNGSTIITTTTTIANLDKVHTVSGLSANVKLALPGDGERSYNLDLPSFNQASFISDVNSKLANLQGYTAAANNLILVRINGVNTYAVVDLTGNGVSNDDGVIHLVGYNPDLNGAMFI